MSEASLWRAEESLWRAEENLRSGERIYGHRVGPFESGVADVSHGSLAEDATTAANRIRVDHDTRDRRLRLCYGLSERVSDGQPSLLNQMNSIPAADHLTQAGMLALAHRSGASPHAQVDDPFDAVYVTYRPLLRRIAIAKFGIPASDADDLVQDVFATYLVNPANVRDVHAYLIGGICNAARQHQRSGRATPFCDSEVCLATPDNELLNGVIRTMVIRATLSRLTPTCRDALERFHLHGERAAEIATRRDTTANYVARLLTYCRQRAREAYQSMLTRSE